MLRTAFGAGPGLEVRTPFVNGKVVGTEFLVSVEQDRTLVDVLEGRMELTNEHGSLTLASNQSAVTLAGQAPQLRVLVRPRDAVQWAMYYQPVVSPVMDPSLPETAYTPTLRESLEELRGGRIDRAFELLEQIPEAGRDVSFYVYRASLLLGVGRLEEARSDLDQALILSPKDGEANALKAIIAVAQNDREQALVSGRMAVEQSPCSAAAKIALSYALQADLELEASRDTLLQAVEEQPDNAIAWARLAELWLSLD